MYAGVAQLVEHYLAKVDVASSNLVSRSNPLVFLVFYPATSGVLLLARWMMELVALHRYHSVLKSTPCFLGLNLYSAPKVFVLS